MTADLTVSASDVVVFVDSTVETKYGPKVTLGGDTYEAKDAIKSADFDSTHRTWSDRFDAWTVDANDEAVSEVRECVQNAGYTFGGPASKIVSWLRDLKADTEGDGPDFAGYDASNVWLEVEYHSDNSDTLNTSEGWVTQIRDDETVNFTGGSSSIQQLCGAEIRSPKSFYPHMGEIESVSLTVTDDAETETETKLAA